MNTSPLFDTTRDVNDDICRNIVSLRRAVDLFDDLSDGVARRSDVAVAAEMRVKAAVPPGIITRGLHYTTAIEYPFVVEPYLNSRYGNGTYGVWYGADTAETSIYETVYHMIQDELKIETLDEEIVRERAVYEVRCQAILLDLSAKRDSHPELVADHYTFTQALAKRVVTEGHPGLLAPSARCAGTVAAIFNINVLSDPRTRFYLNYRLIPATRTVYVERSPGKPQLTLKLRDGRLHTA